MLLFALSSDCCIVRDSTGWLETFCNHADELIPFIFSFVTQTFFNIPFYQAGSYNGPPTTFFSQSYVLFLPPQPR